MALNLIKKDESRSVVSIKLDEQEFHNIFKEYYAALCSFAFQYMEDADMSADIVQDVFAKLWQIRDDFFYLHQVKAFLYTAVRNHALNELEHSKVAHEYVHSLPIIIIAFCYLSKSTFFSIFSKKIFIDSPCFYFGLYYH